MSLIRRSLEVVPRMAEALGEPLNPNWITVLSNIAPEPTGWLWVPDAGAAMGASPHNCSFCGWDPKDKTRTPTCGDCQFSGKSNLCAHSNNGVCPKGMGLCAQEAFGSAVTPDGKVSAVSKGNSQSIFPCFPGDSVGTNSTLAAVGANTVVTADSWSQGNAFTKAFSAAARVIGPGLLNATIVFNNWEDTLRSSQQPNFIPFNAYSGFETVGAVEYVNYLLLQSDPGGFLGLFDALPPGLNASFTRLRGRGGFVVSSSRTNDMVGTTRIVSGRGVRCVIRRPPSWTVASVHITDAAGTTVPLTWDGTSYFSFATVVNGVYIIEGS